MQQHKSPSPYSRYGQAGPVQGGDSSQQLPLDQSSQSSNEATISREKQLRQAAEADAAKLANRVQQLRREEGKAQQRIEETRRKAQEVLKLRNRNEQRSRDKDDRARQQDEEVRRQRQEISEVKEASFRNRLHVERRFYKEKLAYAEQAKEERAAAERCVAERRLLTRVAALERKEAVRAGEARSATRQEQQKLARLRSVQADYERRVQEEVQARMEKERELRELAALELELIERLKRKQLEQQQALQQLEAAIGAGRRPPSSSHSQQHAGSLGASHAARPRASLGMQRSASLQLQARQRAGQGPPGQQPQQALQRPGEAPSAAPGEETTPLSALQPMPGEPTEEEVALAFAKYDPEGTTLIPTSQLGSLMADLGMPLSGGQLQQAIEQLDRDGAGQVSYGEFSMWWAG